MSCKQISLISNKHDATKVSLFKKMNRLTINFLIAPVLVLLTFMSVLTETQSPIAIPNRIISIVPAVTEILFAIGAGPQVVAVSSFDRTKEALSKPRVGGLLDPNIERVLALRPDLVILYESQVDQQIQLKRAEIPVLMYQHGGLSDVTPMIRKLGKQTGHIAQAQKVATQIERELENIRQRVKNLTPPRTLLVFGREPYAIKNVYASGGIGFLHDMLETAGGENVFGDLLREAAHPTSEMILAIEPEVIIELQVQGTTENQFSSETKAWNRFSTIPAVRSDRVHVLTGSELVIPGPRVAEVTRRLATLLHPKAF